MLRKRTAIAIAIFTTLGAVFLMAQILPDAPPPNVPPPFHNHNGGGNSLSQIIFDNDDYLDADIPVGESLDSTIIDVDGFSSLRLICSCDISTCPFTLEMWYGPVNTLNPPDMVLGHPSFISPKFFVETPIFGPNSVIKIRRIATGDVSVSCAIYAK